MAALLRPRRWAIKPGMAHARVDRGSPLAAGLTGLWLLNEGGGTAVVNLANGAAYGSTWTSAVGWATTRRGVGIATTAGGVNAPVDLVASDMTVLPTTAATVLLGYRKRDTTYRATCAFGLDGNATASTWFDALVPYADGNVYWDFGGATSGSTRLVVSGLTFGDDLWAFTAGARGMEVWQNGLLRGSQAAAATRAQSGLPLALGQHVTVTADYAEWWLFAVWQRQLAPAAIQALAVDPFALLAPAPARLWTPATGAPAVAGRSQAYFTGD